MNKKAYSCDEQGCNLRMKIEKKNMNKIDGRSELIFFGFSEFLDDGHELFHCVSVNIGFE